MYRKGGWVRIIYLSQPSLSDSDWGEEGSATDDSDRRAPARISSAMSYVSPIGEDQSLSKQAIKKKKERKQESERANKRRKKEGKKERKKERKNWCVNKWPMPLGLRFASLAAFSLASLLVRSFFSFFSLPRSTEVLGHKSTKRQKKSRSAGWRISLSPSCAAWSLYLASDGRLMVGSPHSKANCVFRVREIVRSFDPDMKICV